MPTTSRVILQKMLDRLFAALIGGPGMNCRPHSSRQRVDLTQLGRLLDGTPEEVLRRLLGEERKSRLTGRAVRPAREMKKMEGSTGIELSAEERQAARQWSEQQGVMTKLRSIADDARTYEQDTGVHVLNIGFPVLSLPPGAASKGRGGFLSRRIVAPIAFIPVTLEVKTGNTQAVEIACKGEGVDLVRPNIALLAWLERETGRKTPELFDDREAENPWREIRELVSHVAGALELTPPISVAGETGLPESFALSACPRSDDDAVQGIILPAAVLGLFPMANEGLLRDTQEMAAGNGLEGPVTRFLELDVQASAPEEDPGEVRGKALRQFSEERLVAQADPCQSRAALLARQAAGLVIHGPPGTGKSQTITNIIGDHLARGQRVLMVCDKRTALDVVAHRLDHLGLGGLLAIVHDPQRDQRDLYRTIRERLENLAEARTRPAAVREVSRIDAELQQLHGELSAYWKSLMDAGGAEGLSFHDVMGQWLAIDDGATGGLSPGAGSLAEVALEEGRAQERTIKEALQRGRAAKWPENPWTHAAGLSLRDFLAHPLEHFRGVLRPCLDAGEKTRIATDVPMPGLVEGDLQCQADLRLEMAGRIEKLQSLRNPGVMVRWSRTEAAAVRRGVAQIDSHKPFVNLLRSGMGGLDAELRAAVAGQMPTVAQLTGWIGVLGEYLLTARRWHGFLQFRRKREARQVLMPLGLALGAANAERARDFMLALRARLAVVQLLADLGPGIGGGGPLPDDDMLDSALGAHEKSLALLALLEPAHRAALQAVARGVMQQPETAAATVDSLRQSAARAKAVGELEAALRQTSMLTPEFLQGFSTDVRSDSSGAERALAALRQLVDWLPTLEDTLRTREALAHMVAGIQTAARSLLEQSADPAEGFAAFDRGLLAAEISRRLREDSWLQAMDAHRLQTTFERYRQLDQQKRTVVRDAALHFWVERQKERLLASTRARASTLGADLRRRLTMRGERALRLRQIIEVGQSIEDGDPLFDMCPVWMASPETVAQIFPRQPIFDVVIFDEASQCRLEEALPVLTRGRRVVIAGDPKQLPPTRFFESTISASDDEEIEDQQDLFERTQGEVEDLLSAALNLPIENAYLDVHYRSRNADLIGFSNQQFYHSRLQAIPGHPSSVPETCPISLYRVDGVYEERANEKEAEQVCRIVHDLLRRAEPPSIGIASFNLVQRDLIIDKLDEMAEQDAAFGSRLAEARSRRGAGSFEGLFVKNLENVQGDERDHIIISTTYGPQKDGRFRQNFGPLGRAGGGRRLNVLITRARQEVHLVTSIPESCYRSLPPVPAGETPGGAWLLYAYLQFAERLGMLYAAGRGPENGAETTSAIVPRVVVQAQQRSLASLFSESLADRLLRTRQVGSIVHWGNDGFCVDVAVAHPLRPDGVTIGVLCDGTRFRNAEDPVEWDLFRTLVHESQGWKLHRIWTPQFFRAPEEHLATIESLVQQHLATERPVDAIRVEKTS